MADSENSSVARKEPRPIEFMERGYTLRQMKMILARWQSLTPQEIQGLGFNAARYVPEHPECLSTQGEVSPSRCPEIRTLRVVQGGDRSDRGAALKAIREPSEEMIRMMAVEWPPFDTDETCGSVVKRLWRAGIDAIFEEKPNG